MKRLFFLFTLLCLVIGKAQSQGKLKGTILEEASLSASFATVSILSAKDSSNIKSAFSDENGNFLFDNIAFGEYIVGVSYIGFNKTFSSKLVLSSDDPIADAGNILLKKNEVALKEVVVKAQKKLIDRLPDRFIMNVSSSSFTNNNLLDMFQATPFMTVQGKSISFKGKPNLLVLVDNRPIPKESLSSLLESMTGGEIEKIEFITAPSSRYDASVDGVINIITKRGMKEGLTGSVRGYLSQGIYGNGNTGINLTYRKEKFTFFSKYSFMGGTSFNSSEGYRAFTLANNRSVVFNTEQERIFINRFHSPQVGVDIYLNKNHTLGLVLDANIGNPPVGKWNSYTYFSDKIGGRDSTLFAPNNLYYKNNVFNYSANYRGILDKKGKELNVIVTYTPINGYINTQLNEQQITDNSDAVLRRFNPLRTNNPSKYNIWIGQADFTLPLQKQWKAELGFKVSSSQNESQTIQQRQIEGTWKDFPEQSFFNTLSERITSVYSTASKNIKKTYVKAGLRAENTVASANSSFNLNYTNLFPSFLVQQNFTNEYQLTFNYRRKIVRPSYGQILPYTIILDLYTRGEGNIALKPQYSNILTLTNSIKNNTYVTFEYSHNKGEVFELPFQNENVTTWKQVNLDISKSISTNIYQTLNLKPWWQLNNFLWGAYYDAQGNANNSSVSIKGFAWSLGSSSSFTLTKSCKLDLYYSYDSPKLYGLAWTAKRNFARVAVKKTAFDKKGEFIVAIDDIFRGTFYGSDLVAGNLQSSTRSYQDTRRISIGFNYQFGKRTVTAVSQKNLGNQDVINRTQKK